MTTTGADQTVADHQRGAARSITSARAGNHAERRPDRDEFTAWLRASCQRQGLPVTITDPAVLSAVAALLR
jgi:hypothetical protein